MSLPIQEQWRPIPEWEDRYEVSDQGNVRSVDRVVHDSTGRHRHLRGQPIRPWINKYNGRRMVRLKGQVRSEYCTVYSLVIRTFVGPQPKGMEVCHNDGDCLNDRLDNLRWDTSSANKHDLVRHGRHYWACRDKCMRGHLLREPNLSRSFRAGRGCLACQKARGFTQGRRRKGLPFPDMQTASDAHYARIMTGADIQWLYQTT